MATLDELSEIKAIESLKARYCRCLDTKDWSGFRAVFADDFVGDMTAAGGDLLEGADAFVAFVRGVLGDKLTVHHVQQPEIHVETPTSAHGVWAMQDVVRFAPGLTMHGFGHYDETYDKDGQWRIKSSKLTRLREEIRTPLFTVLLSDRMRSRLGRAAKRRSG